MSSRRSEEWRLVLPAATSSRHDREISTNATGDVLDLRTAAPAATEAASAKNLAMYEGIDAAEMYRNFLDWLFATFRENETIFRTRCLAELGTLAGKRLLITGCGLGEDVAIARDLVGADGTVHAQDLSQTCMTHTAQSNPAPNVFCHLSDALALPYRDGVFDAVYHTGGINLFGDVAGALSEMERVCKLGGVIVFGDESIAPHLRQTEYGLMFLSNNPLWRADLPLQHLPVGARDIQISYVLGNCFYLIRFTKGEGTPLVDIDVPHLGYRGGSVRTRHFGTVEGIDVDLKHALYAQARKENTSVNSILTSLVQSFLEKDRE